MTDEEACTILVSSLGKDGSAENITKNLLVGINATARPLLARVSRLREGVSMDLKCTHGSSRFGRRRRRRKPVFQPSGISTTQRTDGRADGRRRRTPSLFDKMHK